MREPSPTLLLGRYRSDAVIGEGAFGRVVRAFDTRLKRPVAIKTLKRSLAQTDLSHFRQLEDRFVREAEAGARVGSHANLVTVYDLIEDDDRSLHLVLLFVPGGTIGERLATDGPFPLADALRLTADIARGLQAAHDAGIVHRDIKPANVFIATDGRAQVGDFGIAQLDHLSARTYAFIGHPGTPLYMSPEQSLQTGYVRPTSDQYSAGLVLFEMLHGQPYKRLRERDVADFLTTLPQPVAALIERMTAPVADDRYRELSDVVEAIRRIEQILDLDIAAPIKPPPLPSLPAEAYAENPSAPPEVAIPVRPLAVPSNPTPDERIVAPDTPDTQSVAPPLPPALTPDTHSVALPLLPAPTSDGEIAVETAERVAPAVSAHPQNTRTSEGQSERVATRTPPPPDRSYLTALSLDRSASSVPTPARRRSRGTFVALVSALLVVVMIGVIVSASRLRGGNDGSLATATAPVSAVGGVSLDAVAVATVASPTASATAIIAPLLATATSVPTAIPTATPQPTVAPTATATAVPPTATAVSPTATPIPSLGVFGVGTTDRGYLETLSPADAVDTFTVGQEVFAFINYDGARPGVDTFDLTLIANDAAQPPQSVALQKTGGFVFVSLGQLAAGNYRIEVRHGDTLLPNQPTFQVKAPAPTPVPVSVPRATVATGGKAPVSQPQPAAQPATQPKAPTCVPGTC